jgi:signal transduction histidine kinase
MKTAPSTPLPHARFNLPAYLGWGGLYLLLYWGVLKTAPTFNLSPLASIWFLPAGLNLALLVRFGPRFWPWLVLGSVLAFIEFKPPEVSYAAFATPRAYLWPIGAALNLGMAVLIRRFAGADSTAWGVRSVLAFLGIVTVGAFVLTLAILTIYLALGRPFAGSFWTIVLFRWIGDMIGILVLVPLLLMPLAWPRLNVRAAVDAGIVLAGVGLLYLLAKTVPDSVIVPWVLGAVPVLALAVRSGMHGAMVAVPVIATAIVLLWLRALPTDRLWELQFFLIFLSGIGLLMAGAMTDQRRAALTLLKAQQRRADRDRRQIDHLQAETTRFVTALVHDLRHPVEAIRMLAQPLTQETEPVRTTAGLILDAVQNSRHLLDHLLEGARFDRDVAQGSIGPVEAAEVLRRVGQVLQPFARQEGVRLTLVPSRAVFLGEPLLAYRLLVNLGLNAVRSAAMADRSRRVVIGVRLRGDCVALTVADSGAGMQQGFVQRLLGGQGSGAEPPLERQIDGLGLGLGVVRRIAESIGIGLCVRLGPMGGTRIESLWPAARSRALPVETVGLALKPGLARSLLVETLTQSGVAVLVAETGRELRQQMRRLGVRRLEAVVLDAPEQARHLGRTVIIIFRPQIPELVDEIVQRC